MLMPAEPPHTPINIDKDDQKYLLKQSGALMIRWTNDWDKADEGSFWYIIKERFDGIDEFSKNTRSKIRRGLKRNQVERVSAETLSERGHEVYLAAFSRYKTHTKPLNKKEFQSRIKSLNGKEHDFWGIFQEGKMVGYAEIRKLSNVINTSVLKYHPDYLKDYTSYALLFRLLESYLVNESVQYITNGSRNISHDTNIQDFLLQKFNFRKAFCTLQLAYKPVPGMIIKALFPIRQLFAFLPGSNTEKLNALLNQEYIRRNS
jgi:hypothetical protein